MRFVVNQTNTTSNDSTLQENSGTRSLQSAVFVALFVALILAVVPAFAQDVFYLSCSNQEIDEPLEGDDDNIVTMLYEVSLDEVTQEATLTQFATSPLNQADAIACNQENRCYLLDRLLNNNPDLQDGGFVEEYIVGQPDPVAISQTVLTEDTLGFPNPLQGLVLAAFHPDGTLYAASQDDDRLYTIDLDLDNNLSNPTAAPVGFSGAVMFEGSALDLEGADIAFAANHRVFLWTNGLNPGLFELTLPADNLADTTAVQLEAADGVPNPNFATGLAIRNFGAGNVMMASTIDEITEHSLADDGLVIDTFAMVGEEGFDHESGDMAHTFNCLMQCEATEFVLPGENLSVDIELFHNTARTANQAFEIEIVDPEGRVRFNKATATQEFESGSRNDYSLSLPIPTQAAAGHYTVRLGVAGMQQGEAVAECNFEIGSHQP